MNISSVPQITGNICVGLAAVVLLLPLQRLLSSYAGRHFNDNQWTKSVLQVLIPLWLLLMGALLCVTATGGFDGLRLNRSVLHVLTIAASVSLAAVTFVFVAFYVRPGFTPRSLYTPFIYLIPIATALLVLLTLNPKFLPGFPIQWLRAPWVLFAGVSLLGCIAFFGHHLLNSGRRALGELVQRIGNARDTNPELVAQISKLDPRRDFEPLLGRARPVESRVVREAATARLRTNPQFIETLAAALESRDPGTALEFLTGAALAPEERKRLARPALAALERFIRDIPAPNYITRDRQKQLLKWGRKTFPLILGKFTGTDVDFSKVMPDLEHALRPDDTRR